MQGDDPDPQLRTEALAGQASDDPTAAFQRLYERIAPSLVAWAGMRIPAPLQARLEPEEVAQEVWARAMAKISTFDPDRSPFRAWIFRIAGLVLLESFRRLGGSSTGTAGASDGGLGQIPGDVTSVCQAAARKENVRTLLDLTATLNDEERRLLLHRGLEGLPHDEVATILGVDPQTAMKRWQRLRTRLGDSVDLTDLLGG